MQFAKWLQEGVRDYRPELFDYLEQQPDNVLLHFTNHHRIGYKTKPHHQDPIGIYTFPKKYVLSKNFNKNSHFFGLRNVFILKLREGAKILNLSTLSEQEVNDILEKMEIKQFKDVKDYRDREATKPGFVLWDTIEKYLAAKNLYGAKKNLEWNRLFKKAGDYDAIVDEGDSIIHHNEPSQVLILNIKSIIELDKLSSEPRAIYKNLALRTIQTLATKVFDSFQISTRKDNSRITVTARGTKNNTPYHLLLTYYSENEEDLRHSFSASILFGSPRTHEYLSDINIRIPIDEEFSTEEILTSIAEKINKFIKETSLKDDKQPVLEQIMSKTLAYLGFGGKPTITGNNATFKKFYPGYGLFQINGLYSIYGDKYFVTFTLKDKKYALYGSQNAELPSEQVENNLSQATRWFIEQNITYMEDTIEKHYNIDFDKHSDWEKRTGRAFDLVDIGRKMKHFVSFLKNKFTRQRA